MWRTIALVNSFPKDRDIELWKHPLAKEWDSMTLDTWAKSICWTSTAVNLINQASRGLLTVESKDVSYLFWLDYIRGAGRNNDNGSILRLTEVKNGAQQDRIKGGSYNVSIK